MIRRLLAFIVLAALVASACGSGSGSPAAPSTAMGAAALTAVPSTAEWPAGTPDSAGLDPTRIGDLVGRIRRGSYGTVTSLLIVRNDRLVVEEYFAGTSQAAPHTMQSVSKSITSLLAGIAID